MESDGTYWTDEEGNVAKMGVSSPVRLFLTRYYKIRDIHEVVMCGIIEIYQQERYYTWKATGNDSD